jgi:hypothetical protein
LAAASASPRWERTRDRAKREGIREIMMATSDAGTDTARFNDRMYLQTGRETRIHSSKKRVDRVVYLSGRRR